MNPSCRLMQAVVSLVGLLACGGPRSEGAASADLVIEGVSVVDVASGRLSSPSDVFVTGGRISAVRETSAEGRGARTRVIDGRGRFLIPGLWDMHSHSLWDSAAMHGFLPAYVAAGVTGIRDVGGRLPVLEQYRRRMAGDTVPWPRVVASGEVIDGDPPVQADISIGVRDSVSAERAVDSLARAGVDFIKPYSMLTRDAFAGVLAASRRHRLPVAGHLPLVLEAAAAPTAGLRSIEHLREELEPFCFPRNEAACAPLAAGFREHEVWQVPTLVAVRPKAYYDDGADTLDPRLASLPAALRADWLGARRARARRTAAQTATARERYAHIEWLVKYFADAGVPLLVGSDAGNPFAYPGTGVHDEMALLVRAGLTPQQALYAATLGPARFLGAADSMGTVAPGRVADLVLLRRDPVADIGAVREIEAVILRGQVVHGAMRPEDQNGLVVDIKRDSSGPLLLVNDSVIYPSQRDSVLRTLRGATLDSVFLLPGNTDSTFARYGSRGNSGVVLIYSRSP